MNLAATGALGGWLGGLLAMLLFRHKTTQLSFQLKYALAFVVWAGLIYVAYPCTGSLMEIPVWKRLVHRG